MTGKIDFTMHKYQEKVMKSPKRFLFAISGIQAGKTYLGCMWLIKEILKGWHQGKDYSYLIAAPTYKILQQSTLRKWFELAPSWLGEYKEQKSVYELKGGKGIIYIRSTEDPDALEGMTLKAAWLDEAGQMSDRIWYVIQGRLTVLHGRLLVTTTPYTYNWIYSEGEQKYKNSDDIEVVKWESVDSPWFPKDEYERQKKLAVGDPNLRADFERRYRGMFRQVSGLVYRNWHDKYTIDSPGEHNFKEFIGGIDWGYTNPSAVDIIGISDFKPKFIVVDEFYEAGKTIEEIMNVCFTLQKRWKVRIFYADPSRPDYINQFNTRGIPTMIGDNDIQKGISNLRKVIDNEDLYVLKRCFRTVEELNSYHYPEVYDMALKEEPVKVKDHAVDALRYAITTHVPVQVEKKDEEKPIWKMIKESLKPISQEDDGLGEWYQDGADVW